jgi:hypothetical protein
MRRFLIVNRSGSVPLREERMRAVAREREASDAVRSLGMGEVVRCYREVSGTSQEDMEEGK